MPRPLYLDSARLGQFSINARRTLNEFLDFVGSTPTHLGLIDWLRTGDKFGSETGPLSQWRGIGDFEQTITKMFGAPEHSRTFIASRSTSLIRIGLQQLFNSCRRCMTIDTCWPRYLQELHQSSAAKADSVFVKSFRRPVYDRGMTVAELCENLYLVYCSEGCDGLFLPAVDYLGTRIPVSEIVRSIRKFGGEVRFVLVDAAQGLGHVPLDDDCKVADFVVAGTHKWLGSYSTLGVAIAPNATSIASIESGVRNSLSGQASDDGLLNFIEQLRSSASIQSETINLCPLFTAFGATAGLQQPTAKSVFQQLENAHRVIRIAEDLGWNAELPDSEFRSGILLLQLPLSEQLIPASRLQQIFIDRSVFLTTYERGLIRLSMPAEPLRSSALQQLEQALTAARFAASSLHALTTC